MFDPSRMVSFDTETFKFFSGRMAPLLVCSSAASVVGGRIEGVLVATRSESLALARALLVGEESEFVNGQGHRLVIPRSPIIAGANVAFDLCVLAANDESLVPLIFAALREGRIYDVQIAMALDAIHGGHLSLDPRTGGELKDPTTRRRARYNLNVCTDLVLGRTDAKVNDVFRKSYGLLYEISPERWPVYARSYPIDDAVNTLEIALRQIEGWVRSPLGKSRTTALDRAKAERRLESLRNLTTDRGATEGEAANARLRAEEQEARIAEMDGEEEDAYVALDEYTGAARNVEDLPFQVEAAFGLSLGSCWGLRTDPQRVDLLAADVEEKHRAAVERYQRVGYVRRPCDAACGACDACAEAGKVNTIAVKRAVAVAYGARGDCARCGGTGKVRLMEERPCRGEKVRGRYRGCPNSPEATALRLATSGAGAAPVESLAPVCGVCGGSGILRVPSDEKTCEAAEGGCDGTTLDLSTAPHLPRSPKGGIKKDRDSLMESGDEELSSFGENEFEKVRSTFVPWLRGGIVNPGANILVASGRCSYDGGPLHQVTRESGRWVNDVYVPSVRECFRARGAWCGSPVEYVYSSTDYSAGELCALAQFTYWAVGYSKMLEAINKSGDPGVLHSEVAAEVLGISLSDFLVRLKAKDKQAVDFRQSSKPINFGAPARMGAVAIVLTSRKKSAGSTVLPSGETVHGIRFCVMVGGAARCGARKIVVERRNGPAVVVCADCVDVVKGTLLPAYFRRFPEIEDYFDWADSMIRDIGTVPSLVWDAETGWPRVTRRRGGVTITSGCNNGFQAMLADVGKLAWSTMVRESYLGVREDGSESPLAGCRPIVFMHDEPICELIEETAHLSGPRVAEIMMQAGKKLAPDVVWKAETALSHYWAKSMEPVYSKDGQKKLLLWEPARPDLVKVVA